MLRLLQALLLAVKKGSDYWKSYYSEKNFPKNASDYCTAYIAYMRFLTAYQFGRNNTYQTTVQVNLVEMGAAVVHNAQRTRTRQNRTEPPGRKAHKHPQQNGTRHRTQHTAPVICRNIKKPKKIFLIFLKKSDFTGEKWILCRENSGKNGPAADAAAQQQSEKQHQHREKAASGTAPTAEKHGTGADAAERKKARHSRTTPERAGNIGI